MTEPGTAPASDPQFTRALIMAAVVEGLFIAAGVAAYIVTRNMVLLFALAIAGVVLFGLLFLRAFTRKNSRGSVRGADPIVRDGGLF